MTWRLLEHFLLDDAFWHRFTQLHKVSPQINSLIIVFFRDFIFKPDDNCFDVGKFVQINIVLLQILNCINYQNFSFWMLSLVQASFCLVGDVNSTGHGVEEDAPMVSNRPLWTIEPHDIDWFAFIHSNSLKRFRKSNDLLVSFLESPFLDSSATFHLPHWPISVLFHCWYQELGWSHWSVCRTTSIMHPDWQFCIDIRCPVQVSTIFSVDNRFIPLFWHLHDSYVLTLGRHWCLVLIFI